MSTTSATSRETPKRSARSSLREMTFNTPSLPEGARVITSGGLRGRLRRIEGATALVLPEGRQRSIRVPLQSLHVEGREPERCQASILAADETLTSCGRTGTAYRVAATLPPRILSRTWYRCPEGHAWRIDQYENGHRRYPLKPTPTGASSLAPMKEVNVPDG